MTSIRPGYLQFTPQAQPQPQGGQASGKSAIFALARAQAAAQAAPVASPVAAPAPVQVNRVAEAAAEPPHKVLRPGSLLDIRI